MMEWGGRRVGLVGIDADNQISIYVGDESALGNKIATDGLNWICEKYADRTPLRAEVHVENDPSKNLFKKVGFEFVSSERNWEMYEYSV